jgi:hypothetical protein
MIEYFNMFNGGLSEVSSKSTTFPVDDLKTFDVLIGWIQLYVKIGDYTLKIAKPLFLRLCDGGITAQVQALRLGGI